MNNYEIGKIGESAVILYLERSGCVVLNKNFRTRNGEIDVIFLDGDTLVFGEVKTRRSGTYGAPMEAVDERKSKRIIKVSNEFIARNGAFSMDIRYDVFEVFYNKRLINHVKNAQLKA